MQRVVNRHRWRAVNGHKVAQLRLYLPSPSLTLAVRRVLSVQSTIMT